MAYTRAEIESLRDHVRAGHAACKHDLGGKIPEVLDYLIEMANLSPPMPVHVDEIVITT